MPDVSLMPERNPSYEIISLVDLYRLALFAQEDREHLFAGEKNNHAWRKLYEGQLICTALCQGAALHYIKQGDGIKDFDVWSFFARNPEVDLPPRRRSIRDFADPKFGKTPGYDHFTGRKVDFMMRSIDTYGLNDPEAILRHYLQNGQTESARQLARKAVVLLEPDNLIGKVIWQPGS